VDYSCWQFFPAAEMAWESLHSVRNDKRGVLQIFHLSAFPEFADVFLVI